MRRNKFGKIMMPVEEMLTNVSVSFSKPLTQKKVSNLLGTFSFFIFSKKYLNEEEHLAKIVHCLKFEQFNKKVIQNFESHYDEFLSFENTNSDFIKFLRILYPEATIS